jgi:gliding motility-associated-like protein
MGPGVTGTTFTPAAAGVGTHQLGYKANSCSDTAWATIVVNAIPTPSISGLDTAYCIDNVPQVITPVVSPTGGTLSGPGVTGSTFNIGTAGAGNHTITYSVTNANNCTAAATALVHVRALPTVQLTIPVADKYVCEFDGSFLITGATPNPGWPTGWFIGTGVDSLLGTFTPDPNILGWNVINYHYYDGMCSGSAVDSILVQANPTVNFASLPVKCQSDAIMPLVQGSGLPTGGTSVYSGTGVSGGAGIYFFDPSVAGPGLHAITYCYTGPNTCSTCVTQNILVVAVPAVSFNPPPPLCENGGPIDLTSPWLGQPSGGYYSGPGIDPTDSTTLRPGQMGGPGSYSITYTYVDTNGCSDQATVNVNVNPKPVITITAISPNPTPNPPVDNSNITVKICEGDTAICSVTSIPTASNVSYSPNNYLIPQSGNILLIPPTDLLYEARITAINGCKDTGFIFIDVIPPALAEISGDFDICMGDETTLIASGATTYNWLNPVASTPEVIVSPKANTIYQVVADSDVDGDGKKCSSDTAEVEVVVHPLPLITTSRDTILFFGDKTNLKAYGGVTYFWSEGVPGELSCDSCPSPIAFPIYERGSSNRRGYYVIGIDEYGCVNGDSIYITLNPKIILFVPNAFSPNGDGFNDVLFAETKGIARIEFEIFDRNGKTVFETNDLTEGWDGIVDGTLSSKDVYLYRIKAYPYEKTVPPIDQAGQISLIR